MYVLLPVATVSACDCGGIDRKEGWMGEGWAKMGYWLMACCEQVEGGMEGGD